MISIYLKWTGTHSFCTRFLVFIRISRICILIPIDIAILIRIPIFILLLISCLARSSLLSISLNPYLLFRIRVKGAVRIQVTMVTRSSTMRLSSPRPYAAFLVSVFLSFFLFIYLLIYLFICLFVCLFIYLFIYSFFLGGGGQSTSCFLEVGGGG